MLHVRHCYCPLIIHTPYLTSYETRVISNTIGPLRLDHPPAPPPAPDRDDTFTRVSLKVATGDRSRAATLHGHSEPDLCVGHTSYHLPTCPTTFEISFYVILRERPGAGRREQRRCTFVSCVAMILAGLGRVVRPSGSTAVRARVHISIQYYTPLRVFLRQRLIVSVIVLCVAGARHIARMSHRPHAI